LCPGSEVVWVLLLGYHQELQISNNNGNLPLHMACEANQQKGTI
jgi:hypothetical protein